MRRNATAVFPGNKCKPDCETSAKSADPVRNIELSRLAETDLDRLEAWLVKNGAPYAVDLGATLDNAITNLRDFPERGRHSGFGELRELVVQFRTWSYVVTYSVTVSSVIIARIHHGLEDR